MTSFRKLLLLTFYWSEHSIPPFIGQSEGLIPRPTAKNSKGKKKEHSKMDSTELS